MILGIKISKTLDGLSLYQSQYIEVMLKKFKAYDDKSIKTPVDLGLQFAKYIGDPLMYITNCAHPNIAHIVNKLSGLTTNPSIDHSKALTRVLKYLKHMVGYGLHSLRYPAVLEGHTNANLYLIQRIQSLQVVMYLPLRAELCLGNYLSKRVARSTMESKFIVLDKIKEEVEWLIFSMILHVWKNWSLRIISIVVITQQFAKA